MKRKILLSTFALPLFLLQNVQAQTASRMIAAAHWTNNGASFAPADSSIYHYTGTRGGSMDLSPLNVDPVNNITSTPAGYDSSTNFSFTAGSPVNNTLTLQTFDAHNNVTSTITETWNTGTSSYDLSNNRLYTYNASNMITSTTWEIWGGSAWVPSNEDVYSYNSAGKLYLDQENTWNTLTSAWDPAGTKTYYYDSSMNMINETDQSWSGGSPVYTNQWMRTFSSTNQLLTTTASTWNGTSWVNSTMYTHAYDSVGNPLSLLFQLYNTGTHAWDNSNLALYSNYTAARLPQTVNQKTWNGTPSTGTWVNSSMLSYVYNSYNQVTNMVGISWNVVGTYEFAAGDPAANYYYETYGGTTSVKSVSSNGGDANIYPVPAQNMLHVDLNWSVAQTATIRIIDMTGNVVRQWNTPSATQYNSAVSVNNLASGMYVINITGQQGQIVKQIVVSH